MRYVRETLVANLLALGERFTSKGGLVDGNVDGLDETAVGRDDVTDLESNHITGDEVSGLDLLPGAVALDTGLRSERIHKSLDRITSVPLFVETDGRVDEQQEHDTDEILPVGCHVLAVREDDGDDSGGLHDPGEGIPHETEELRGKAGHQSPAPGQ